jgi:hypothetical protein
MPRRASSSVPPWLFILCLVVLAVMVAGGWFAYRHVSDPFRTLQALDVAAYLENGNSLRGNVYKITGTIADSLSWSPTEGRLFSIEVENRREGVEVLPLLIPAEFNAVNVQKGQRYTFKIEVVEKGLLRAQDIRKT